MFNNKKVVRTVVTMHLISGSLAIGMVMFQTKQIKDFIKKRTD